MGLWRSKGIFFPFWFSLSQLYCVTEFETEVSKTDLWVLMWWQCVSVNGWYSDFCCVWKNWLFYFYTCYPFTRNVPVLPQRPTHLHTYQTHPDADVCCQLTASPCLLPPPPLLKETVTWPGLTKTNAFPLAFQLAVAPTWSWGRNLSFQKEVLRAWLRSAPVVDVLNQAPVTPRQPAPLPPLPTVGPLCPQLPLLPLHRRLQHHPGWVEAAVTVVTLNMI